MPIYNVKIVKEYNVCAKDETQAKEQGLKYMSSGLEPEYEDVSAEKLDI